MGENILSNILDCKGLRAYLRLVSLGESKMVQTGTSNADAIAAVKEWFKQHIDTWKIVSASYHVDSSGDLITLALRPREPSDAQS